MGSLTWGSELSLLWENVCDIIILQLVGCPSRGMGLDYIANVPFLLSWDFFSVFGYRKSLLVGFSLS